MSRISLAVAYNTLSHRARSKGPFISPLAKVDQLCGWRQWRDPNGSHEAREALFDSYDPYSVDEVWSAIERAISD